MGAPQMESDKWLWQPHKSGPIFLRLTYRTLDGKIKTFVRSLHTDHWLTARKIRDTEFTPIILDMATSTVAGGHIYAAADTVAKRREAGAVGDGGAGTAVGAGAGAD